MPVQALHCKECGTEYPLEARYVCEPASARSRSLRLHGSLDADVGQAPHPGRARRTSGATPTSCRSSSRRSTRSPAGCTPLRARRPAGRAARAARGLGQERRRQPDPLVQGPGGDGRARQGAELGFERSPAPRPATSPTPSPRTRRPPGSSRTCSSRPTSRSRRSSPPASTAPTLVAVRGNYDDVNRLCTELSAERDWAFVNVNVRPYYAEGSKTLGLRDRRAARLRAARPRRRADRVGLAVHEDRARLRGVARGRAARGRDCRR